MGKVKAKPDAIEVSVPKPRFGTATLKIIGISPLVINAFPQKAIEQMKAKQMAGHQAKKGAKREPKDFKDCYEQAKHISSDGWYGIPAAGLRNAMISACRVVGFAMTRAKLSVFVEADGVARMRLVHQGQTRDAQVEILAGLSEGDRVVLNPPADLADGRPISSSAAGAARRTP